MQVDLNRFRETFFQESAKHLAEMEAGLLRLDQGCFDPELLNSIFRAAHSIKGSSGMFGLDDIARFTHALESLLDRLQRHHLFQPCDAAASIRAAGALFEAGRLSDVGHSENLHWLNHLLVPVQNTIYRPREGAA